MNRFYSVIKPNEKLIKTTLSGKIKFFDGPKLIFHPFSKVNILKQFVATSNQYIKVTTNTGETQFIKGPNVVYENPIKYSDITTKDLINVEYNKTLCVYSIDKENNVSSTLYKGPIMFMPAQNDVKLEIFSYITISEKEYLKVEYIDGKIEHIQGPNVFLNDTRHIKKLEICNPIYIESNELIVSHNVCKETGTMTRNIIKGNQYYIPKANEHIYTFTWSGTPANSNYNIKVPNQLKFDTLRNMPQQTYYDILNVRTADHVIINLKLLIFFEITNIERMIDNTNDPICNITTEVSSSIMKLLSKLTFDEFKLNVKSMNDMDSYPTLKLLETQLGIKISKISLLGYEAPDILQKIHNDALQEKTKIELRKEIIKSEETNKSYQLMQEIERNQLNINLQMEKTKAELLQISEKQQVEYERLSKLKEIGVDISSYLSKADKKIEIVNARDNQLLVNV